MESKAILVFRDRPRLRFETLARRGFTVHSAANIREARDLFDQLPGLDAVVVDVQEGVERALEFCEIVHVTRPAIPIVFVRSPNRPSLQPHCAHRVLSPEATEDELTDEILLLLQNSSSPEGRRSA